MSTKKKKVAKAASKPVAQKKAKPVAQSNVVKLNSRTAAAVQFAKVWQTCTSLDEAMKKLGAGASARASRYRAKGIPLKKFTGGAGRGIDLAAVKAVIGASK